MIEPVLEVMVPATEGHENPSCVGHLVLLLAFLQPPQHRLRKGSNHQGQNLLKWDHYICFDNISVARAGKIVDVGKCEQISQRWEGEL